MSALVALRALLDCGAILVRGDVPARFKAAKAMGWVEHRAKWVGGRFEHVFLLKISRDEAERLLDPSLRLRAA